MCARIESNPICTTDNGRKSLQVVGCFEYRNFLFTLPNGTKVLLWGNNPTVEQIEAKAKLAVTTGCKVVIHHHHDFYEVEYPSIVAKFKEEFLKLVPDGLFVTPEHGKWIDL